MLEKCQRALSHAFGESVRRQSLFSRVSAWKKRQISNWTSLHNIEVTEANKWTGSGIADSIQPKKPEQPSKILYGQRHIEMWINQLINLFSRHTMP